MARYQNTHINTEETESGADRKSIKEMEQEKIKPRKEQSMWI